MLIRLGRALAAGLVLAGVLAACTISSETQLVSDDDAVLLLPSSFLLHSYEQDDEDENLHRRGDDPERMTLDGVDYVNADGTTRVRFAALPGGGHAISVDADGSFLYGFAQYQDRILALYMLLEGDADLAALVAGERGRADPARRAALDALEEIEDGFVVSSLDALRLVMDWQRSGALKSLPLVSFIAPDGTEPPETIVSEAGGWRVGE
jgi:hypothetical protein